MNDDAYNYIAEDYHLKRKKPWRALEVFIKDRIKTNSNFKGIVLDLGCGNARNFPLFKEQNNRIIGIDKTLQFLKIAKNFLKDDALFDKGINHFVQLINCDFLHLPLRENSINFLVSIASFHHIKTQIDRHNLITAINDILKPMGFILLSVWRKYQKNYKGHFLKDRLKRKLVPSYKQEQINLGLPDFGDMYISWTLSKENKTYMRFYHFFSKLEIKRILSKFKIIVLRKFGGPNKKDNFFILAQKKSG